MNNGENAVLEKVVAYKHGEFDTLLTITENHLLFQRKKGLFKKKYKVVKSVLIPSIKIVDDKAKIKHKKGKITIQTFDDKITFTCMNSIEGMKVVEAIKKQLFGENFIERSSRKGTKILKGAAVTVSVVGGCIAAGKALYDAIKNNKDKAKDLAVSAASLIKK